MRQVYQALILTVVCCLFCLQNSFGQSRKKDTETPIRHHEVGFNATFLIQEFFGTLDVNKLESNTIVQYKWVKKNDSKWVPRIGLGGSMLLSAQTNDEAVAYGGHLRLGMEHRTWMSPKFAFLMGPDLLGELDYRSRLLSTPTIEVRSTDLMYRAGVAPFWGVMYRPADFISISLESAFVAFYRYDTAVTDYIRGGDDLVFESTQINAKYDYPLNIYVQLRF